MTFAKIAWKPGNLVMPAPAALVSCQEQGAAPNLLTVAWCGNINSDPPMLSVSIQPIRYSYGIIERTGEFVVNLPSRAQAKAVDYCGVVSGRSGDKFAAAGLTPVKVGRVSCPGVGECPINISCRMTELRNLGSHVMFLAMVEEVAVSSDLMDEKGAFRVERADLLCFAHGMYFSLGAKRGHFGWSVRKKRAKRKPKE